MADIWQNYSQERGLCRMLCDATNKLLN